MIDALTALRWRPTLHDLAAEAVGYAWRGSGRPGSARQAHVTAGTGRAPVRRWMPAFPSSRYRHGPLHTLPLPHPDRVASPVRCYPRSRRPVAWACNIPRATSYRSRCCVAAWADRTGTR